MFQAFHKLTTDGRLLFLTRFARLFAYGFVSVVLVLYLTAVGLSESAIGQLLTLTLLGDTAISLWLTTAADRLGRRKTLVLGAALMILAGVVFGSTGSFPLLLVAAILGVISPSGNEVGPFLAIEQASLAQTLAHEERTQTLAWYNLTGSLATALGSACGGFAAQLALAAGESGADVYRPIVLAYAGFGGLLAILFARLSPRVEVERDTASPSMRFGLRASHGVVARLAALFALDAFGGGFVMQTFLAYWFHVRFGAEPVWLGAIFFGANVLAGASALLAGWLARRVGLINTMVFTHLPSNVLLMLVPLMPTLPLAILVLLMRFAISQMDVPTRQSYALAVVRPEERSAASGITGVARSIGASLSPALAGALLGVPALMSVPFFLAGGIKIVYDLALYRSFIAIRPPEERGRSDAPPDSRQGGLDPAHPGRGA
jgi:MFS family permease